MAKIWLDREAMDKCGFNADLEIRFGAYPSFFGFVLFVFSPFANGVI
jgi:hypothetical protein